jgi:hypothetical protein
MDEIRMGDLMPQPAVAIGPPRRRNRIQPGPHRPVTHRMHLDGESRRIQRRHLGIQHIGRDQQHCLWVMRCRIVAGVGGKKGRRPRHRHAVKEQLGKAGVQVRRGMVAPQGRQHLHRHPIFGEWRKPRQMRGDMQVQPPSAVGPGIGLQLGCKGHRFLEPGQAEAVEMARQMCRRPVQLRRRRLQKRLHQTARRFNQDPGRLAIRIPLDLSARRIGRLGADRCQPQGERVQPQVMLRQILDHDGVIRGDKVQHLPWAGAKAGPVIGPPRPRDDPFPRRRAGHPGGNPVQHLRQIGTQTGKHFEQCLTGAPQPMGVAVDQPRHHRAPMQLVHHGPRPRQHRHIRRRPHRQHPPAADGHSLRKGQGRVHRPHHRAGQDQIGFHGNSGMSRGRSGRASATSRSRTSISTSLANSSRP